MTPAPIKDFITFDDFAKLDIRVGTITTWLIFQREKWRESYHKACCLILVMRIN